MNEIRAKLRKVIGYFTKTQEKYCMLRDSINLYKDH